MISMPANPRPTASHLPPRLGSARNKMAPRVAKMGSMNEIAVASANGTNSSAQNQHSMAAA